jgi:hypothetical protein
MHVARARRKRLRWRFAERFASIAAFVVSLLAMLFTGLQWIESRRAASDAEKAMLVGQRAYVGLDNVQYRGSEELTELEFDVRAYGTTPALEVATKGVCEVIDEDGRAKGPPFLWRFDAEHGIPIGAPGKIEMPPVSAVMPGNQVHGHCDLASLHEGYKLSVHGYIAYSDVFNRRHITNFCYLSDHVPEENETVKMNLCSERNSAT